MVCVNTMLLNRHMAEQENIEAFNEAVEERAQEISEEIRGQHMVKINGTIDLYHISDFIDEQGFDVDDEGEFCAILTVDADSYEEGLNDKFEGWCCELATKDINNMEQPNEDY